MKCSFDTKEFCSIENIVMNSNEQENKLLWILANNNSVSYLNLSRSPESGSKTKY